MLRFYVYEPIVSGCLIAPQRTTTTAHTTVSNTTPQQQADGVVVASKPPRSSSSRSLHHRKPSPLSGQQQHPAPAAAPSGSAPHAATTAPTAAAAAAPPPPPVLAGPSAAVAPRWRRQLAAAATFVVSGLEHELFLWYLLRTWDYRWFVFFSLQGALLAAEGRVKRAARTAGLQLHPFVSHLAVLLVLGVCADSLFFPPLVQPAMVAPLLQAVPHPLVHWLGGVMGW